MSPSYKPPVSLQPLLQDSAARPEYIQVKAKGLKAILRSIVEFLETYEIQANLFVKVPAGEAWRVDIQRYGQTLDSRHRIFNVVRLLPGSSNPLATAAEIILPLRNNHTWQGDYFVIIQAETFASLLVAHRLQPVSATPMADIGNQDDGDNDPPELAGANDQGAGRPLASPYRSTYLSVCCSINPALLAEMMAIVQEQVRHMAAEEKTPDLANLLKQWANYCPAMDTTSTAFLTMVDRWLAWQLRLQEHLRQSASSYRRQAMGASSLSSQNEVLINTLRLKNEFLNTVGQELRTPLTTIKTALTLLDSPHLKLTQRQHYTAMISHACDRQSALISGVLNLLQMETSLDQAQLAPVYLADTVPPVVSTYQPLAAEKGVMLAYTVPGTLPRVSCPDAWLRQIVIYLLNNSIKYTPSGGEVWVTARQREEFVELEVRDTGLGIAPVDLPHIFDYFYRGRNLPPEATEGAGLGLSIVQQLLMFCGGSIRVNSQLDQGSRFLVQLPVFRG
ncbi:MAG: histidine kinase [Leptolyngbyaceae cyanobacterium SM2_5_2]|nr:histidine kinase [Leptolyngbyaceae cyanobacterium SM2_5_2]